MGASSNNAAQFGPFVAVAEPLDRLAELAKSMLAGEWRARSDVEPATSPAIRACVRKYQRASSTLRCGFGPWVDVCLAGGEKPGWLRLDVTDADAPAWVCRLENFSPSGSKSAVNGIKHAIKEEGRHLPPAVDDTTAPWYQSHVSCQFPPCYTATKDGDVRGPVGPGLPAQSPVLCVTARTPWTRGQDNRRKNG